MIFLIRNSYNTTTIGKPETMQVLYLYTPQKIPRKSISILSKEKVLVTQWYLTLCGPMDCILPSSSVHGILQTRILEWIAVIPILIVIHLKEFCPLASLPSESFFMNTISHLSPSNL